MRIVSLVPSATETLCELGLADQIVAITKYCIYPANVVDPIPKVGGTKNPNRSRILELKPDIIVMDQDENRIDDAQFFRDQNIELFVTFCRSIPDSILMIQQMGARFHAQERANLLTSQIDEAQRATQHSARSTHNALTLIWRRPFMSINSDTYVHSITEAFGFRNVFAQRTERYPALTDDHISNANPEVVFFPDEPYPFRPKHLEEFEKLFPDLAAVRNKRLIALDGSYLTWHGVRTLTALKNLPSIFSNAGLWD